VDTEIVVYTTLIAAYLQVVFSLKAYGTGASYTQATAVASYIDVSPVVVALGGVVTPPTSGGTTLILTVEYMTPTNNYTAIITVGGAPCPILNPNTGAVVPADAVAQMLLAIYGGARKQYPLSCRVPPGEGTGVPVVLTRDNSTSGPVTISYAPPTLTNVTVADPGSGQGPVTSAPTALQLVPTNDGLMTLAGAWLGSPLGHHVNVVTHCCV
jgi:hypothetical protein